MLRLLISDGFWGAVLIRWKLFIEDGGYLSVNSATLIRGQRSFKTRRNKFHAINIRKNVCQKLYFVLGNKQEK